MKRPRIQIIPTRLDRGIEIVGAVFVVITWLVTFFYMRPPSDVALHFDPSGQPDRFGSPPNVAWLLPLISTIMYVGIALLARRPHWFNYPTKITKANAATQYKLATQMLRNLNASIALLFAITSGIMYQSAIVGELPVHPLLLLAIVLFPVAVPFIIYARQYKKSI